MGLLDAQENTAPVLAMHDSELNVTWALGVPSKGFTKEIVDFCVRRLDVAGHMGRTGDI